MVEIAAGLMRAARRTDGPGGTRVDAGGVARRGVSSSPYPGLIPADGHGVEVLLQGTGDDKHDKNRLHLDLRTAGLEWEAERIAGLGLSLLADHPVI
jgi:hypothetical protein